MSSGESHFGVLVIGSMGTGVDANKIVRGWYVLQFFRRASTILLQNPFKVEREGRGWFIACHLSLALNTTSFAESRGQAGK